MAFRQAEGFEDFASMGTAWRSAGAKFPVDADAHVSNGFQCRPVAPIFSGFLSRPLKTRCWTFSKPLRTFSIDFSRMRVSYSRRPIDECLGFRILATCHADQEAV
jgi:hypothetical protein